LEHQDGVVYMLLTAGTAESTDLATALAFAARRVSAHIHEVVTSEDMSVDQWSVFDVTVRTPSPLAMSEVMETVGLTGPSLTRAVDKLVAASLIFREIDPQDRRRVLIYPSRRGREIHAKLEPKIKAVEDSIIGGIRNPGQFLRDLNGLGR
jgi:DNA-binding MarR family transcriptional regulator